MQTINLEKMDAMLKMLRADRMEDVFNATLDFSPEEFKGLAKNIPRFKVKMLKLSKQKGVFHPILFATMNINGKVGYVDALLYAQKRQTVSVVAESRSSAWMNFFSSSSFKPMGTKRPEYKNLWMPLEPERAGCCHPVLAMANSVKAETLITPFNSEFVWKHCLELNHVLNLAVKFLRKPDLPGFDIVFRRTNYSVDSLVNPLGQE